MSREAWVVECPAYTAGPFPSEGSARRVMEQIETLAACMFDHATRRLDA